MTQRLVKASSRPEETIARVPLASTLTGAGANPLPRPGCRQPHPKRTAPPGSSAARSAPRNVTNHDVATQATIAMRA